MYTHTHTATFVGGLSESLLNGRNELLWDIHSDCLVLKLQFGHLLTCHRLNVTNDATILTCATTLLLMEIVKAACNNNEDYIMGVS